MQKMKLLMTEFRENVQNPNFYIQSPFHRWISLFKIPALSLFFTLLNPNFMQIFRKKQMSGPWDTSKRTSDGLTDDLKD